MSSDIYSKPDLSRKVRYNRKAEEDRAEWQQKEVCIYESADDIVDDYTVRHPQVEGQQIQNQPAVKKQAVRRATLCKGVLCIVVLAGLISLCVYITMHSNKLNYSHSQQLEEISVNNSQLQRSKNQLTDELKLLKNRSEVNITQLQGSYEILRKNYSLLKEEVKQLELKLQGKVCPEGWKRFGCSCYFRSTETKYWFDSSRACQGKGAHLVIIDSEEEQKFVADMSKNGESWIGLEVTNNEWKWVDRSPLTKDYWETGWPYEYKYYYATCCSHQGKWRHSSTWYLNWICEKKFCQI